MIKFDNSMNKFSTRFLSLGVLVTILLGLVVLNMERPTPDSDGQKLASYEAAQQSPSAAALLNSDTILCQQGVIYVNDDATGDNNGIDWANALTSLQDALACACSCSNRLVEIWVAEGTYYPDEGVEQTNDTRSSSFNLCRDVYLYGGFTGNESQREDRDFENNRTILSGDIDQNDLPFEPTIDSDGDSGTDTQTDHQQGGNAFHVVTIIGADNSRLDGFTVRSGRADGESSGNTPDLNNTNGAGILAEGSSYTIVNSTLEGNLNTNSGGGLYDFSGIGALLFNVKFISNSAPNGGSAGMATAFTDQVLIYNSQFIGNNQARSAFVNSGSNVTIANSLFTGNNSFDRGTIHNRQEGVLSLLNCTITGNTVNNNTRFGSGLYNNDDGFVEIRNSILWNNGFGQDISLINDGSPEQILISNSIVANSGGSDNWQLNTAINGGENKDIDPLFVQAPDPEQAPGLEGDARLRTGSPAVDMGALVFVFDHPFDLAGVDRIQNGIVDMGAFEGEFEVEEMDSTDIIDSTAVDTCIELTASAGADVKTCSPSVTLDANTPTAGGGIWTIVSGDSLGVLSDPSDPNSAFTGTESINYTLRWTVNADSACAEVFAEVVVRFTPGKDTPPTLECPPTITIDCGESIDPEVNEDCPIPKVVDFCDIDPDVTFEDDKAPDFCTGGEIVRTWTATNEQGLSSMCKQKILINPDRTAPTIEFTEDVKNAFPEGIIEVSCDSFPDFVNMGQWVEAQDSCSAEVEILFEEEPLSFEGCIEGRPDSMRCMWTAVDSCGNASETLELIMVVVDDEAPVIECPDDVTLECNADISPEALGVVTATDNCDKEVDITFEDLGEVELCEGGEITRIWRATDACGNMDSCIQTITILPDTEAPTLAFRPEFQDIFVNNILTLECTDSIPSVTEMPGWVQATDNCDNSVNINFQDITMDADCSEDGFFRKIVCTWLATDDCGNNSDTLSVEIRFVDNTSPELTCPTSTTVSCGVDPATLELDPFNTLQVFDACNAAPTITFVDSVDVTTCDGGVVFRTITATDKCGNSTDCTTEIIIQPDTIAPAITECPVDLQLSCNPIELPGPTPDEVSAIDDCSEVTTTVNTIQNDTTDCMGTLVYEYVVADECGNADTCTQTIMYQVDNEAPVIENESVINPVVVCNPTDSFFVLPELIITENCGIRDTLFTETEIKEGCVTTLRREWVVVDECFNRSEPFIQEFSYSIDTLSPILIGCPKDMDLGCNPESLPELAQTIRAIDDCGAEVQVTSDTITVGCETTITNTWVAVDACSNSSDSCTQLITFTIDTIAPEIITPIDEVVDLGCNPEFIPEAPVVEAFDSCGVQDIIFNVTTIDDGCQRTIVREWFALDMCGNSSDTITQLVNYTIDKTPPTLVCPPDEDLGCNPAVLPMASLDSVLVSDNCGDQQPIDLTVDTLLNDTLGCFGVLQYEYTATDFCGNTTTAVQTITYAVDNEAPVAVNCPEDLILDCNPAEIPAAPEVRFHDNCEIDSTSFTESAPEEQGCMRIITRTWTAVDACGNVSDECIQKVYYQVDTAEIEIVCPADSILAECNPATLPQPNVEDVAVIDGCYGEPFQFNGSFYVLSNIFGSLEDVSAEAELLDGALVSIDDEAERAFLENNFGFLDSFWLATSQTSALNLQGIIELDAQPYEITAELIESDTIGCEAFVVYEYTATGKCGQMASCTQTITYSVDNEAPIITACPVDEDLGCNPIELPAPDPMAVIASDNCAGDSVQVGSIYALSETVGTWEEVRAEALARGGDLVAINDAAEQQDLESLFNIFEGFWIGLRTTSTIENFSWSNGDPLEYTNWNPTTPRSLDNGGSAFTFFNTNSGTGFWSNNNPTSIPLRGIIEIPQFEATSNLLVTVDTIQNDTVGCQGTLVYEYLVSDACGNTSTCTQTFTYTVDNEAPVIECLADVIDLGCNPDSIPAISKPNVTDNCTDDVTIVANETNSQSEDGCTQFIERQFIATDACGNADTCIQIIQYTIDTIPPTFVDCPEDIDLGCNPDSVPEPVAPVAEDNCGMASVELVQDTMAEDCQVVIERTWTATDSCGNTNTCTQLISYSTDTVAPVIDPLQTELFVQCNYNDDSFNPTAVNLDSIVDISDNCSVVNVSLKDNLIETGTCDDTGFTERWACTVTATDACGNTSEFTFFVNVLDTIAPVIIIDQPDTIMASCDEMPAPPIVLVEDNCDANYSYREEIANRECVGGYDILRTWTATDACGNTTTKTQVVQVRDEETPTIEVVGRLEGAENGGEIEVACEDLESIINQNWVRATDNCDPAPLLSRDIMEQDFTECTNGATRRVMLMWTATDDCGNTSEFEVTLLVIDQTAPVLLGIPADTCVNELPSVPLVKATDDCSSNGLMVQYEQSGPFNCGGGQEYERVWTAMDLCGNTTQAIQRIIINDNEGPGIALSNTGLEHVENGDTITINAVCDTENGVPGLKVLTFDGCTGNASSTVTIDTLSLNAGESDSLFSRVSVFIEATDLCGNVSTLSFVLNTRRFFTSPDGLTRVPVASCFEESDSLALGGTISANNLINLSFYMNRNNAEQIIIERSKDNMNFVPIAKMKPSSIKNYRYADNTPWNGDNYYRVTKVNRDGTINYSNTILIGTVANVEAIRLYPNPTTDQVSIEFGSFMNRAGRVQLYNPMGQLIQEAEFDAFPANSTIELNNVSNGLYQVVIIADDGERSIHPLTIQRN